jgi:hypothetical protein
MKPVPVVAIDPVRDDVQTAYDYFEDRVGGTGDEFLQRYFAATDGIGLNAETFPVKFDDYRRAFVPRSHFAVYYFVELDRAVVVAVIDARRNPMLIRRLVRARRTSA